MIIKILTDSDVNVNMFHSSKNKKIDCTATSLTRKRRGKREQHPPICYAFRGCFNCLELSSVMYLDVSRVKHVISNTSACSSCNVSTFDWYPLFLVRIWSFIHFNDKTRLKHHWTCNIQSIMNCSTLCVGWSLSLSLCVFAWFFSDIPTGFKISFPPPAASIYPTPGNPQFGDRSNTRTGSIPTMLWR